jgi:hypothetical protein
MEDGPSRPVAGHAGRAAGTPKGTNIEPAVILQGRGPEAA